MNRHEARIRNLQQTFEAQLRRWGGLVPERHGRLHGLVLRDEISHALDGFPQHVRNRVRPRHGTLRIDGLAERMAGWERTGWRFEGLDHQERIEVATELLRTGVAEGKYALPSPEEAAEREWPEEEDPNQGPTEEETYEAANAPLGWGDFGLEECYDEYEEPRD